MVNVFLFVPLFVALLIEYAPRRKRQRSHSQRKLNIFVGSCSTLTSFVPLLGAKKKGLKIFHQPQSINQQSLLNYPTISLTSAAKPLLSNLMLGPIVVVIYTDLTKVPFAEDGLALIIASTNVAKFLTISSAAN